MPRVRKSNVQSVPGAGTHVSRAGSPRFPFFLSKVSQEFYLLFFFIPFEDWYRLYFSNFLALRPATGRTPDPASVFAISKRTQMCLICPVLCDYTHTHVPQSQHWILQKRLGKGQPQRFTPLPQPLGARFLIYRTETILLTSVDETGATNYT